MLNKILIFSILTFSFACKSKPQTELASDAQSGVPVSVFDPKGKELGTAMVDFGKVEKIDELLKVSGTFNEKKFTLTTVQGAQGLENPVNGERSGQTQFFCDDWAKPSMVLGVNFNLLTRKIERASEMIIYGDSANANAAAAIATQAPVVSMHAKNAFPPKDLGQAQVSFASSTASEIKSVRIQFEGKTIDLVLAPDKFSDPVTGEAYRSSLYFTNEGQVKTHVISLAVNISTGKIDKANELIIYSY